MQMPSTRTLEVPLTNGMLAYGEIDTAVYLCFWNGELLFVVLYI